MTGGQSCFGVLLQVDTAKHGKRTVENKGFLDNSQAYDEGSIPFTRSIKITD
jgi:hypothetical protein